MSTGSAPLRGSLNRMEPEEMVAVRGSRPMMAWLHTDLPEPDSPTSASVPPGGRLNETWSTARNVPSWTPKSTVRFSTRSRLFHTFSS